MSQRKAPFKLEPTAQSQDRDDIAKPSSAVDSIGKVQKIKTSTKSADGKKKASTKSANGKKEVSGKSVKPAEVSVLWN